MSDANPDRDHGTDPGTDADRDTGGGVRAARRTALNEDWAATVAGLVLLVLVLVGAIPGWIVP